MRIDQSRHQRGAGAVDDRRAMSGKRPQAPADMLEAVALNDDLAGEGIFARAVEHPHIRENDVVIAVSMTRGWSGIKPGDGSRFVSHVMTPFCSWAVP